MPWYEYSTRAGSIPLPLVEVRLWRGLLSLSIVALADSGADTSLLDISYADELGLDRGAAEVIENVGASGAVFTTYRWSDGALELQFEQERFPFLGSFVEFGADVDAMNLLGRRDFFQRFVIQFWDAAELMNIDLSPDFPRSALR